MCKRQRAEVKTDGAAFEERQRRHDQSGSGGCAADGAANQPERGAGRSLPLWGGNAGAPPSLESVGRGRAKRARQTMWRMGAALPTTAVPEELRGLSEVKARPQDQRFRPLKP